MNTNTLNLQRMLIGYPNQLPVACSYEHKLNIRMRKWNQLIPKVCLYPGVWMICVGTCDQPPPAEHPQQLGVMATLP